MKINSLWLKKQHLDAVRTRLHLHAVHNVYRLRVDLAKTNQSYECDPGLTFEFLGYPFAATTKSRCSLCNFLEGLAPLTHIIEILRA